jgi:erythronate-4-phosphate dehydrogenase
LEESDIVTTHVPITKEGQDKTLHLADASFFSRMKPGSIFMNAARGAVVNSDDLLKAIKSGHLAHTALDTWEGEPDFRRDLLQAVDIGTPHIAGHSFEGKVAGTVMVYQNACRFLGIEPTWTPDALLPPPLVPHVTITASDKTDEQILWEVVKKVYNIESDDARLRAETDDHTDLFDSLRKNYPIRREFRFTSVTINNTSTQLQNTFERLGFRKAEIS